MNKREYLEMYKLEDTHFWFTGKRYFVDSILDKYSKRIKTVLDIGSGTGGMTKHMSKYGKITGVEQNSLGLTLARKRGLNVIKGNANALKFKSNQFDLITIFDVLYHKNIKDEAKILSDSKKLLKNKGLILITDSALNFLKSSHDEAVQGARRYSLKQMTDLLEKQEFKILRATYSFATLFPAVAFKRLILEKVSKPKTSDVTETPPFLNNLLKNILKIEAGIVKHLDMPIGTSIIVLAQKK